MATHSRADLLARGYGDWAAHVLRGTLEGDARSSFTDTEVEQAVAAWLMTPEATTPSQAGGFRAVVLPVGEVPVDGDVVVREGGAWAARPGGAALTGESGGGTNPAGLPVTLKYMLCGGAEADKIRVTAVGDVAGASMQAVAWPVSDPTEVHLGNIVAMDGGTAGEATIDGTSNGFAATSIIGGLHALTACVYAVALNGTLDDARQEVATLQEPGMPHSYAFWIGSCMRWMNWDLDRIGPGLRDYANPVLAYGIQDGDYHYADGDAAFGGAINTDSKAREAWRRQTLVGSSSVQGWWQYLKTRWLAYMPDDHEGANDYHAATNPTRGVVQRIFRERFPTHTLPAGLGEQPLYFKFQDGRTLFLVTDCRTARSAPSAPDNASKTMLGATQKALFFSDLAQAAADVVAGNLRFVHWVNPVGWHGDAVAGGDNWRGYTTERSEITDRILSLGLGRRMLIGSGDYHCAFYDNGSNAPGGIPCYSASPINQSGVLTTVPCTYGPVVNNDGGGISHMVAVIAIADPGPTSGGPGEITVSWKLIDPYAAGGGAGTVEIAGSARSFTTASGPSVGPTYRDHVLAKLPTAYLRLNETVGTVAVDEVAVHHGTYLNTPTLGVTGPVASGHAVTFDAAQSECVQVDTLGVIGTGILSSSWEIWFKGTSLVTSAAFGTFSDGTSQAIQLLHNRSSTDTLLAGSTMFYLRGTDGKGLRGSIGTGIYDGAWHHLAVVVLSFKTFAFYVDGIAQTVTYNTQQGPVTFAPFQYPCAIAARNLRGVYDNHGSASYAEFAVYPRRLSAAEVLDNYNAAPALAP